jgi:pimeloyl-ACP methyl ester carboxylesterase
MPLDDDARQDLLRAGRAEHFVTTSLGTMHVREAGPKDGPAVLLVHGGVIGGYAWREWQQPLAAAGYHVLVPDLLGYGYSDRPSVPYTKEFYVRQLTDMLDTLSLRGSVHIVGASSGGAIAMAFTAQHPQRVRSVTLIAPAGAGHLEDVRPLLLRPLIGDWIFRVLGARQMTAMMKQSYPPSEERDALVDWMKQQASFRGYGEGVLNTLRHYDAHWQPNDFQTVARAGTPVLVLWGTSDTVNAFSQSKQLILWVPEATLVSLPGKPHAITFGEAPLLLRHVLPFLKNFSTK